MREGSRWKVGSKGLAGVVVKVVVRGQCCIVSEVEI